MKEKKVFRESNTAPEIKSDMKLYFAEMHTVLVLLRHTLSSNGISLDRSRIDMVGNLALSSVDRIGKLSSGVPEKVRERNEYDYYAEIAEKITSGELVPKSKIPEKYAGLFQDLRTLYFFAMETVMKKNENIDSYEGTLVGIPAELIANMLDKIVDSKSAKDKWDEIKGDKNKIRMFFHRTKWQVDDLPKNEG
jgi:hypothetical protein